MLGQMFPDQDNQALEVTLSTSPLIGSRTSGTRSYLLCFADNTAITFDLPTSGAIVIGRAPEVDLRLDDNWCRASTRV